MAHIIQRCDTLSLRNLGIKYFKNRLTELTNEYTNMSVKGLILQQRDIETIRYIHHFPLPDTKAIHAKLFSQCSYSSTARRLKKLYQGKLLNRVSSFSDAVYRYYVTQKNCQLAGLGESHVKRIRHSQLTHDIELYDCLREIEQRTDGQIRIIPDFQLRQYAKRNYRQSFNYRGTVQTGELRFLPDALIKKNGICTFLEWDRDTIHGINLHRKILAYHTFFTELEATRLHFDISQFRVLFVCPNKKRCENIRRGFEQITGIGYIVSCTERDELTALLDQRGSKTFSSKH